MFSVSDCEGEELLRTHLLHHANLSLRVEGLRTGYCKDVHGEVGGAHWLGMERWVGSLNSMERWVGLIC